MSDAITHTEAVALELYTFLREIDAARWRGEMENALLLRLRSIERRLGQLIESSSGSTLPPPPMVYRLTELALVLRDHTPDTALPARAARRQWMNLRARLLPLYEALAAGLRAEDVPLPSIRPTNYSRIAAHGTGMVVALVLLQLRLPAVVLIAIAGLAAGTCWFLELLRRRSSRANAALMHFFRRIAHPVERLRPNSATWFATALFCLACLDSPLIGAVSVIVLGIGDPVAGLVGRRWGRIKLLNERSLEGSLAFVASGFVGVLGYLMLATNTLMLTEMILLAAGAAISGAVAELLSRRVDDNFSIPLSVALGVGSASWLLGIPMG